ELRFKLRGALDDFIARGKRIIGICNGFQVLVKTGYLPGLAHLRQGFGGQAHLRQGFGGQARRSLGEGGNAELEQTVTLAANDSGRFQCHWVKMKREKSACEWLAKTDLAWELPIAHGEGKFVAQDAKYLAQLEKKRQVVFRYVGANPNGSQNAI